MNLFHNAKIKVIQNWTTGITSGVSAPYDTQGMESVTFIATIPQTTTNVTFLVQGAATTTAGDFAQLQYNSTNISVASTVTGGCMRITIDKPHPSYRYLKTSVNSTGVSSQGQVIAFGTGVRVAPTTSASTEIVAQFYAVSPTT